MANYISTVKPLIVDTSLWWTPPYSGHSEVRRSIFCCIQTSVKWTLS